MTSCEACRSRLTIALIWIAAVKRLCPARSPGPQPPRPADSCADADPELFGSRAAAEQLGALDRRLALIRQKIPSAAAARSIASKPDLSEPRPRHATHTRSNNVTSSAPKCRKSIVLPPNAPVMSELDCPVRASPPGFDRGLRLSRETCEALERLFRCCVAAPIELRPCGAPARLIIPEYPKRIGASDSYRIN